MVWICSLWIIGFLLCKSVLANGWHLDVQSRFVQGWDSESKTVHMIVINAGEKIDGIIRPLNSSASITIIANQDLKVLIPNSKGEEMVEWKKQDKNQFYLNDAGRFSFLVPLESDHGFEQNLDLSELLVQSEIMESDEW